MDYKKAAAQIVRERRQKLDAAQSLKQRLIDGDEEFYRCECDFRAAQIDAARGKKVDFDALEKKRTAILKRLKISEVMLNPPYSCDKCKDTAYFNGKPCDCAAALSIAQTPQYSAIPLHNFNNVNLDVFSPSSLNKMTKVYETLKTFTDKFPDTRARNIILMGNSGGGKTFLAGCIAGALMDKGMNVAAMTAFGFVNDMLSYHTTFNEDKLKFITPILECDLLVIDDLGTESILKNVTKEYLYLVLNERMLNGKHTLITTNLEINSLSARYGERITSRLFDSKISYAVMFDNEDLRKNKSWK